MSDRTRARFAGLVVIGMLALSPLDVPPFSADPPPARVLPIGDPVRRLDPWRTGPSLRSPL